MRDTLKQLAIKTIWVHAGISILHGLAHVISGVYLPLWGSLYVGLVITVAPFLALWLLKRDYRAGMWLLTLSMLGSLLFGLAHHFIVPNPDHVSHVHEGQLYFFITSSLVAASETAGVLIGILGLREREHESTTGNL